MEMTHSADPKALKAEQLYRIRHSLAHVLGQAVKTLWPEAKLGFGPPIDTGCYYDFLLDTPIQASDLPRIESEMRRIIKEHQPFTSEAVSGPEALGRLERAGENLKIEYAQELLNEGEQLSFYTNGPFEDLCRGPHVSHTGEIPIGSFCIESVAGAYWRGDERRPQLHRIYCAAFASAEELAEYQRIQAEAKERDHRKLGREHDLFSIQHDTVGGGLTLWHPKGGAIRHAIEMWYKDLHVRSGYELVSTPHIGRSTLWQTSGHLSFYKEGMFAPVIAEEQEFYLKPMNCPFHCMIFASQPRTYRELPLRLAEWGTVYRFERSGTLHGLLRVRGFTQDDSHLFCTRESITGEVDKVLRLAGNMLRSFGFSEFAFKLSTRPKDRVGDDAQWDNAENALADALSRCKLPYEIQEGDGAFYGPKIDLKLNDALGRPWQLSTIQFDFNLPARFSLEYTGKDGHKHQPYMIHRALLGSVERFFAVLIEHYRGVFPGWLAPVQVALIPVKPEHEAYCEQFAIELRNGGTRVSLYHSDESLSKRVKRAWQEQVPFALVVGDREVADQTVTVKVRGQEKQETLSKLSFAELLRQNCSCPKCEAV